MEETNSMSWSLFGVWNDSLLNRKERELTPRNHIWASELGGSLVDRYLKMKAVKPTNPPNPRSLRKFEAGNIWEWILTLVLKRSGILLETQGWVAYQYPDLLQVTGKLDLLAGGKPDYEKARVEIQALGLPEVIDRGTKAIIDHLNEKYPTELKTVVLEIKSVSSFMFERYEKTGVANPNHRLQLFHYLKAKDLQEGHVIYVCKDDCRMLEMGVYNPSPAEQEYVDDITAMTKAFNGNTQPDKEPEVTFDTDLFKFSKNWKVEYSNYLTMLYGYSEPEAFRERWDSKVGQFNRVFNRMVSKAKMTKLNLEVIKEMEAYFPNVSELVIKAQEAVKDNPELLEEPIDEGLGATIPTKGGE